jgi:choline dehydrogenase-like flavoprotein
MFIDFNDGSVPGLFEADLCIIGAGAAGISIARTFIGAPVSVCVVESGSFEFDASTQALYDGEIVGSPYVDLDACRMRMLGGSTIHWGGWCAPYDDIDFEQRPWVPHSGWPIGRAELEPFYQRAQQVCGLGDFHYDERVWNELGIAPERPERAKLEVAFIRVRAQNWAQAFRDELGAASNLSVLLNANVGDIAANEAGTAIAHLDIRSLQGRTGRVRARAYILACGGMENARLLLSSNGVQSAGLGNQRDLVGRFLMDHPPMDFPPPPMRCATVLTSNPGGLMSSYGTYFRSGLGYVAGLRLSPQVQRAQGLLNCWGWLQEQRVSTDRAVPAPVLAAASRSRAPLLDAGTRRVLLQLSALEGLSAARASRPGAVQDGPAVVTLLSQSEQAPNPQSRITLSDERDALGMRKIRVDWRVTELDKRSVRIWTETVGGELLRLNMGRLRVEDWLLDGTPDWPTAFRGAWHHIGTTRMATDPGRGVVDETCRVHGIGNLYIAGCSVFPTSGWVNPTFTIVALSLRLADYLRTRLA